MRTMFKSLVLLLALFSSATFAADTKFLIVEPDQGSYSVGEKAVLFLELTQVPEENTAEFFVRIRQNEQILPLVHLTNRFAVAFTPEFAALGRNEFVFEVFQQPKFQQTELEKGVVAYDEKINILAQRLKDEVDPVAKEKLQEQMDYYTRQKEFLLEQMESNRTLLETGHFQISVSSLRKNALASPGIFSLRANHDPAQYVVGEQATFFVQLLTEFKGPDGPREHVFRGDLDGVPLPSGFVGSEYTFLAPVFLPGDVGTKTFHTTLYIRSRAQSNKIRNAVEKATDLQDSYILERDAAVNEAEQAYLQLKIDELGAAILALNERLEAILLEVTSGSFSVTVTN